MRAEHILIPLALLNLLALILGILFNLLASFLPIAYWWAPSRRWRSDCSWWARSPSSSGWRYWPSAS